MKNQFKQITWLDSRGCSAGWQWKDDLDTTAVEVISVGTLIAEDDSSITIAPHTATTGDDIQCMGAVTIAKCQIISSLPLEIFSVSSCRESV